MADLRRFADGRACFKNASQLLDLWLGFRGEPFQWGIRHEELPAFLEQHGFSLAEITTPESLRARYLAAPEFAREPLADRDYPCVAWKATGGRE